MSESQCACICTVAFFEMNHKPKFSPPLNELTGDGPNTRARQDVPVEHAQLQLALRLLQLPDHLVDELKVALAVADEGVKQLRSAWV